MLGLPVTWAQKNGPEQKMNPTPLLAFTPAATDTNKAHSRKKQQNKHPLKNPNEIHQFTNLQV